jgi:hypothetical protein
MAAIAILGAVVGVAGRIVLWQGDHGAATAIVIVAMLIGVFLAMLALLGIIGGWGLLAQKDWARVLVIVLGILHLISPWVGAGCLYALGFAQECWSGLNMDVDCSWTQMV